KINKPSGYTCQGVNVFPEDQGDLVEENIAEDASHRTGNPAHYDANPERQTRIEAVAYADNGEQSEPDGVEQKQGPAPPKQFTFEEQGCYQRHACRNEVLRIQHPKGGYAQQEISCGSPSDGGYQADNVGAEPVDILT